MLSRVADAIYWMSRFVERAENLARFIDVTLNVILDQPHDLERLEPPDGDHDLDAGQQPDHQARVAAGDVEEG